MRDLLADLPAEPGDLSAVRADWHHPAFTDGRA
jgi:hypothetical protein